VKTDETEKLFHELKDALESGAITDEEFQAEIKDLLYQDDEGRYWSIGARTEQWYRYDDGDWVEASPPPTLEPVGRETRPSDMESDQLPQDSKWARGRCGIVGLVSVLFLVCLVAVGFVSFQLGRMSVMTATAEDSATSTVETVVTPPAEPTSTAEVSTPLPTAARPESSPTLAPTATEEEGSPAAPSPTSTAATQPTATTVPTPEMKYGPPVLTLPEDDVERGPGYGAILEWEPVGELASGEYYHVTVCWNDCQDFWGGFVETASTEFPAFYRGLARDDMFQWWVIVRVQRGSTWAGNADPPISQQSETWVFRFPEA
jgi:hypothetical protein